MGPLTPATVIPPSTPSSGTANPTGPGSLANATASHAMTAIANAVPAPVPMQHPGKLESTQPHTAVNWTTAQVELKSTPANANVTWKVTDPSKPGSPVWVKGVGGGGERVEVADKAAQALGLQSPNSRVVQKDSPEGKQIQALINKDLPADEESLEKVQQMKQFVIGENVQGKGLASMMLSEQKQVLTDPGFLKDFGKMLALDNGATNNVDRVASYDSRGNDAWQLNNGNFLVVPGQGNGGQFGVATIDNEYVMPSADAFPRSYRPEPGLETATQMATGKAVVSLDTATAEGLGMQNLPKSAALANPQAFVEKALEGLNQTVNHHSPAMKGVAPLTSSEVTAAAQVALQGFNEATAELPALNQKMYGSASAESQKGNPLMSNETLAAKAAYASLGDPKKLFGNSGIHDDTAKVQKQQMFEVKQERFVATAESLKGLSAPGQYPATIGNKDGLTKAVQAESAKLSGYLTGFNNQGVALDYQKALGNSGFIDGIKANYQSFAAEAQSHPKDAKLQNAVSDMGKQVETLDAMMRPVVNRRIEDNPAMLSVNTNYGKNLG